MYQLFQFAECPFQRQFLELGYGSLRVQVFRADVLAAEDCMAAESAVFRRGDAQPFLDGVIAAVLDEPVRFHHRRRADVIGIGGGDAARRGAGTAEDAVNEDIHFFALVFRLHSFLNFRVRVAWHKVRLDLPVFVPEGGHIHDQVFDDRHMAERPDDDGSAEAGDLRLAGKAVFSTDMYSAGTANTLPARGAERYASVHCSQDVE